MVPLLYLCIVYIGKIIGKNVILNIIQDLLHKKIGIRDVSGIMEFLGTLNFEKTNFFMELIGFIILLVTSSAFIVCLRQSINDFFDLKINYATRKRKIVKNILFRLFSLVLVTGLTILVIVFYFTQTVIMSLSDTFLGHYDFIDSIISNTIRHGLSILSNIIIFTLVFKYVNDAVIRWKLALGGALLTSVLLYIGQLLIKYYLFNFFFGSKSGGIAGSIFILLAWVYYSSQIIFFGAKFTAVYARKIGQPIHFKG
jgi:membrane protein